MKQVIIGFGLIILALLILFKVAQYSHFLYSDGIEIWIGIFSVIFFAIGIFLSRRLFMPKPRIIEKEIIINHTSVDEKQLEKLVICRGKAGLFGENKEMYNIRI